jgi:uncharacterized membrane protein
MRGIGVRFVIALLLVCLTWNPTRYNYIAWAMAQWQKNIPIVMFVGLIFAIAWIFYLRATARSLGPWGIVLGLGIGATVIWVLLRYDIVSDQSTTLITWLVLVVLAGVLAMGMSWSHLRTSWAGQADVDDVDRRH